MENYKKKYEESQGYLRLLKSIMTDSYRWDPEQSKKVWLMFQYLDKAMVKKPVLKRKSKKK